LQDLQDDYVERRVDATSTMVVDKTRRRMYSDRLKSNVRDTRDKGITRFPTGLPQTWRAGIKIPTDLDRNVSLILGVSKKSFDENSIMVSPPTNLPTATPAAVQGSNPPRIIDNDLKFD
jgi:hypothetical protein